jgi:DNA-binding transcriptional LysR family regulator
MDLNALKTFKAVADCKSVTKAADFLCCVPSAVTARIRQLESQLGRPLFYRESGGMVLTPSGRVLLGYAEKALQVVEEAKRAVMDDGRPSGQLIVGATGTAATVYLPRVFARYHQAFPEVELQVVSDISEGLIAAVEKRQVDLAIVNRPVDDGHFVQDHICQEELILASALSVEALSNLKTLVLFVAPPGCAQRARMEEWLQSEGGPPLRLMDCPSLEMRLSCVAAGMGVTVLPRSTLSKLSARDTVRVHKIPERYRRLDTYLIRHRDGLELSAHKMFREIVLDECRTVRPFAEVARRA